MDVPGAASRIQWSLDEETPGRDARGFGYEPPPTADYESGLVNDEYNRSFNDWQNSCQDRLGERGWIWLDKLVDRLRTRDLRWGYNGKRGNPNDPSKDVVDYHFGAGSSDGSTQVYIIDVMLQHCGNAPTPAWIDQTGVTAASGTVGRFIYPRPGRTTVTGPAPTRALPDMQGVLAQFANASDSCPRGIKYVNNPWQDRVIDAFRQQDLRWGYNAKPTRTAADNGGVPVITRMRVAWTKPEGQGHAVGLAFFAYGPAQRDSIERMRDYVAARRRELLGVAV